MASETNRIYYHFIRRNHNTLHGSDMLHINKMKKQTKLQGQLHLSKSGNTVNDNLIYKKSILNSPLIFFLHCKSFPTFSQNHQYNSPYHFLLHLLPHSPISYLPIFTCNHSILIISTEETFPYISHSSNSCCSKKPNEQGSLVRTEIVLISSCFLEVWTGIKTLRIIDSLSL